MIRNKNENEIYCRFLLFIKATSQHFHNEGNYILTVLKSFLIRKKESYTFYFLCPDLMKAELPGMSLQ